MKMPCKIIDAHVHLMSKEDYSLSQCEQDILFSLDRYNVEFALVSNCDAAEFPSVGRNIDLGKSTLDCLKEVIETMHRNSGKMGALVWFRPYKEKPTPELIDYIKEHRDEIFGLKLHPWCEHVRPNSKKCEPWYDLAKQLGLPVCIHTAADKYSRIDNVAIAAKRYPTVKFIAAHMELLSDNKHAYEVMKENPNIYADTAWVDIKMALKVIRNLGEDRICFGTDNPIDGPSTLDNPMYRKYLNNSPRLCNKRWKNLMRNNAIEIYNLPLKRK